MKDKEVSIYVIRSVWRRTKKGHIKVRDLQPQKDVKGGAALSGTMRTIAEPPQRIAHDRPLSASETPRARWLHQLRAARDAMIRKLFAIPAEPERKAHSERIAKAQRVFLRWLNKSKK